MAYAYVQKGYGLFSTNTVTWSQATTAGNLLVIAFVKAVNTSAEYVSSVAGNVNTSQTWSSAVGSVGSSTCKIATGSSYADFGSLTLLFLPGGSNAGGDTTTTLTLAGDQGANRFVGAMEFSGIATATPFINYSLNAQTAPGSGTDAVTSGNVNVSTVNALLAGFGFFNSQSGSGTITGTGFAGRGLDASSNVYMWGEDQRITVTGNVPCTFTDNSGGGDATLGIGLAFAEPASGPYSGVNQLDYSVVTGSNSLTTTGGAGVGTLAVTSGNLLVAICYSAHIVGATFSDSSGNPWSPYNSQFAALNGNAGIAGFWCIASTTATPTFTISASGLCQAIFVNQFHVIQNGALIKASGNYQSSIGSGTNNATSGNVAIGGTNNLMFGFCMDKAATASPAQGTGFTGQTAVWQTYGGGSAAIGKPENALMTGTVPATFSTNNVGDAVFTLGAAFNLQLSNLYPIRRARRQLFTTYYPV